MIRQATIADIPRILDIGVSAYGYDNPIRGTKFLDDILKDRNAIILMGDHSFGIGYVYRMFYWKKPRGHILQVASIPKGLSREALRLMQALIAWLKNQGVFEVSFGSEIGTDYEPFAKLLGASRAPPSYLIKFDKEPEYA
jgi:hypothetical protein